MSSKQEYPIQAMGFWMFGFLSAVLAWRFSATTRFIS